jgi:hypothetical protein
MIRSLPEPRHKALYKEITLSESRVSLDQGEMMQVQAVPDPALSWQLQPSHLFLGVPLSQYLFPDGHG